MSIKVILSVIGGILVGFFLEPDFIINHSDIIIDIGLCILLFFVGIDIGINIDVLTKIKKIGFKILLIPFMIILGSVFGAIIAGFLLGFPVNESGAVGAGLGWYTLSSMMLANYSPELSTLSFLSNVVREILALILIPIVAKYIGDLEAIAPSGATAMDTTLPIIAKATNPKTAIISFVTGVILSTSVPILVPFMISL
ncbi:lysine exporter LysO family protein [Senegalia massiliensis]|uniref:Lysine exporter LysO family protein n=1 Tax=Senegalia massiliensis TaxID=1720316 RepID=A0A845QX51_9CLOT|nr:lysine exporter LysO family protein [Senegalia massiliensis]NBI06710.1 lysine exporter LysO family protein [Senegalia massiliensis]